LALKTAFGEGGDGRVDADAAAAPANNTARTVANARLTFRNRARSPFDPNTRILDPITPSSAPEPHAAMLTVPPSKKPVGKIGILRPERLAAPLCANQNARHDQAASPVGLRPAISLRV
jgi:hypothetical protein